jgi:Cu(I)/Ag(I) efflux system protein CusF
MKRVFALCLLVASPLVFGQSGDMKGMDMKDMPMKGMDMKTDKKDAKGTVHKATGVVTKVDKNKVTIKHEPVPSLSWPSMTMAFTVKDKSLMEKMKKDQKVDFEFVQEGKDYVVTAVK